MTNFQLGHIKIAVEGAGKIYELALAELSENLDKTSGEPDVRFRFVTNLPKVDYRRNGNVFVTDRGWRIEHSSFLYDVLDGGRELEVQAAALRARLPGPLTRARHWNFMIPAEDQAKNFMYDVFDWVTQLANLERGQSYLHASSMTRGNQGVAILGWGGVGKTTSMLKLCLEEGWKFLSDDLALVTTEGMLVRTPKRLQIYAYNLLGQPELAKRLLGCRSVLDRLFFAYRQRRFGPHKVRRRVGAEALLGKGSVAETAQLTNLIFLERSSDVQPRFVATSNDELAERMAAIVMAELEPFGTLYRQSECASDLRMLSSLDMQRRTAETLRRGFASARATCLLVGECIDPNTISKTISHYLEHN